MSKSDYRDIYEETAEDALPQEGHLRQFLHEILLEDALQKGIFKQIWCGVVGFV